MRLIDADQAFAEDTTPRMYTKLIHDIPVAYRYGEPWVAAQLWVDGGYPTEEEAIAAWEKENKRESI